MLDIFDHVFGRKRQSPKSEVENSASGEASDGGGVGDDYVHINLPENRNGATGATSANGEFRLPYPISTTHVTPLTQPSPTSFSSSYTSMDDIPFSLHPSLKFNTDCKGVKNDIARCEKKLEQIQELLAEDGYNFNLEKSVVQ